MNPNWLLVRIAAALAAVALSGAAHAERADRDKPTLIKSQKVFVDDLKQIVVYTGNVYVSKGTLRITGERLEMREDPEGYQYAVVTAAGGQLASFRQRRDGTKPDVEEYVEGFAERIEYDGKAETVKLIARAQLRRLENDQTRDELHGSLITYDSRNSSYSAEGGSSTDPDSPDAQVRTIIAPRTTESAAAPAVTLQPAPALEDRRKK